MYQIWREQNDTWSCGTECKTIRTRLTMEQAEAELRAHRQLEARLADDAELKKAYLPILNNRK